ncbi:WYL domain-containing protein [Pseudomonas sp. gcc21]|uniref:helix-turn-helix transcriptional regulator n=1 Tax=Pseudomonas sp. gcc21 TaxID=2726989 RepID=UPI001451499B|nr:WYL domain-containing protein [Pseudomonas sp. gcc21]QJD58401.1 WYL domain-containing protein [Pseudomonas sp. gcc21]
MSQRDTLFRHLAILQMLPRAPHRLATTTIQMKLKEQGYNVTPRSIQRDLEKLADHFPLICERDSKPYRWCYMAHYVSDLPAMDTVTALTLVLAETAVTGLLPKAASDKISYQFQAARKHLEGLNDNGFAQWTQRAQAIPNGRALIPAEIDSAIWERITDALLNQYAVDVVYRSRFQGEEKTYTLHPQGLVTRHSSTYLLALVNNHDDIRQFALHRFRSATASASLYRPQAEFSVQDYIDQGAFGLPVDPSPVRLVARITSAIAWLLSETPLSSEQSLSEPDAEGWVLLEALVPNDQQTQWWIMGYGSNIRVMQPKAWRETILSHAEKILEREKLHDTQTSPSL